MQSPPGTPKRHTRFAPKGAVTGIGSLPFASATSAVDAIVRLSPEIPFWPQLPTISLAESAICQGLAVVSEHIEPRNGGYGYQVKEGRIDSVLSILHRSSGELTKANASGFGVFEETMSSGFFDSAVAVKGQIEGPITLSAYLFHKDRSFLSDPAFFAAIAFHISQTVRWQIDRLQAAGLPVLVFVDEPALCLGESRVHSVSEENRLNALAALLADARACGAHVGLHCCAARPFELMCRVMPDILSFDAHEGLDAFFADPHAREFVHRGGAVAYGIVPTKQHLSTIDSASIFIHWLESASKAGDPQEFAQCAMITATCGLGLLDTSSVLESFSVAHSISKLIRALSGAPEVH